MRMNFSGISNKKLLGQVVRVPLSLIPSSMAMPILQGPLRGKRWVVGSHTHGCWLGSYEFAKRVVFENIIQPGQIVFDIGANAGFYTLLASVLVGPEGQVVAFEPLDRNLMYLHKHLQINQVRNVKVLAVAASDQSGTAFFNDALGSAMGHLDQCGALNVKTVTLDQLIESESLPVPDCIKLDVEGAEARVLSGAATLLKNHHPVLFVATHSPALHAQCCAMLTSTGYELLPLGSNAISETDEFVARYR